jgi:amino acid adenylation domain-containing protein
VVGSPFSGRGRSEFENVVGCFANLLPIRTDLTGDPSFRDLIDRTFETVVDVLQHQDYPFSAIVEQSSVDRDPARAPLVQSLFTLQKSHRRDQALTTQFQVPDVDTRQPFGALAEQAFFIDLPACQHDLELLLEHSSDSINGMLRYYADAFEPETIERMVRNLNVLLDTATMNPDTPISQLDWFADQERQLVIETWNETDVDFGPPSCIHELFEIQAAKLSDAIAVSHRSQSITYGQLNILANRLANRLIANGVKPGDLVAVDLDRSLELIVSILAIMKVGAAYVPIDPDSPDQRKRQLLDDTNAVVVVVRDDKGDFENSLVIENVADLVLADDWSSTTCPNVRVDPSDVAYVIFTSGSTGKPKGVVVEHRAIGNTIAWRQHELPTGVEDRVLLIVPHYFDASLCITLQALLSGAHLVLVDSEVALNPAALSECIAKERITLLPMPPRLLRVLLEHGEIEKLRSVERVHTGGEAMPPELPGLVQKTLAVPFENLYGPTETAVEATRKSCSANSTDANCIGKPIANVRTYVLDENQRPVPIGVRGELYIGGNGLARGYLNDDELTARRFVADPYSSLPGARMYRTGDQCRWLANGELEFIARIDDQVKIRGYRIELGEIENCLRQYSSIDDVAVVTYSCNGDDDLSLVAYVSTNAVHEVTASELRSYVESRLPSYMVPRYYEFLAELPYTPSGKLHRKALPSPRVESKSRELVAPRNELEEFLAGIWQDLLPEQQIGIHDNFYDLGGSSLKGAMLLSRLQDRMGQQIRLATVFHLPDVASLARYLGETYPGMVAKEFGVESLPDEDFGTSDQSTTSHGLLVPLQPNGTRTPLFMVHPPGGIVVCYQALSRLVPDDQPVYGVRSRGLYGDEELPSTLVDMAREYVDQIQVIQPNGPYAIGGWSLGGVVAFEIAQQLHDSGQKVEHLLMLDSSIPSDEDDESGREYGLEMTFGELADLPAEEQLPYLWQHAKKVGAVDDETPEALVVQILEDLQRLFHHHVTLANDYSIRKYPGRITMFRPENAPVDVPIAPDRGWKSFANVDVEFVPGQHHSMVKPPHVKTLVEKIVRILGD